MMKELIAVSLIMFAVSILALSFAEDVSFTLSYSDHEPLGNMRTKFLNDVLFPAIDR